MSTNIIDVIPQKMQEHIDGELEGMKFTKNFRSATAEEWYVFLPSYQEPVNGGAFAKVIIHYDLFGNKDIFINTTVIIDDPKLYQSESYHLVYAISEEIVNRLVGYANTLLSVHCGGNSYQAEYI